MKPLAVASVAMVVGGALAWWWKPAPPAGPAKVQVDTVHMEAERVPLKPSLGQKLTTAAARPTQTRVAEAPSAQGTSAVKLYCEPLTITVQTSATPAGSDSSNPGADVPHSRLPDFQGRRDGPRLSLLSTLNDGRRWSADYHVRGRISWTSDGDSVLVRGDRLWVRLLRGGAKCAPAIAGGGAAGLLLARREDRLEMALLSSAAALLGCLT